jgi:hypothetical protein
MTKAPLGFPSSLAGTGRRASFPLLAPHLAGQHGELSFLLYHVTSYDSAQSGKVQTRSQCLLPPKTRLDNGRVCPEIRKENEEFQKRAIAHRAVPSKAKAKPVVPAWAVCVA